MLTTCTPLPYQVSYININGDITHINHLYYLSLPSLFSDRLTRDLQVFEEKDTSRGGERGDREKRQREELRQMEAQLADARRSEVISASRVGVDVVIVVMIAPSTSPSLL